MREANEVTGGFVGSPHREAYLRKKYGNLIRAWRQALSQTDSMAAWQHKVLGLPSISILSRDPSSQETIKKPGKRIRFLNRTRVEKNGKGVNPSKSWHRSEGPAFDRSCAFGLGLRLATCSCSKRAAWRALFSSTILNSFSKVGIRRTHGEQSPTWATCPDVWRPWGRGSFLTTSERVLCMKSVLSMNPGACS